MTRPEIESLLEEHHAAFASRDPARIAAGHAPDGTFESPAAGKVSPRDRIEEIYRYWFAAFPDMIFDWGPPIIDGDRVAFFWTFQGTVAGPFFGDARPGTRVTMIGAAEYLMSPDGIVSARHVFDFSGALVKAGALKIKPS